MKCAFSRNVNSVGSRPFHEARKHCLQQWSAGAETFREAVLDETGNRVVKTVGQGQRCAAFTPRFAVALSDVLKKLRAGSRARGLGIGAGNELSAVIIRAAGENLLPRLGVRGLKVVAVRQLLDFFRRQTGQKFAAEDAQERVTQTVDAFEMLEEEDEPFEVGGFELAVDAVKRVRDRMADVRFLQVTLQVVNVLPKSRDFGMLRFRNSPDEQVKFARILGEISRNLLADKSLTQLRYFEIPVDRVMIGDRDVIHPALSQEPIELARIGIAVRKIEPPKEPFLRPRAEARMNVEIAKAHARSAQARLRVRLSAIQSR